MINPKTLIFLDSLMKNNNREWFSQHRHQYEQAKENIVQESSKMIELINQFDKTLGYPNPTKTLFRINRDTRFSHNKDPYKEHFGISFSAQGVANSTDSSYYIHIQPSGASFIATGIYMPNSATLLKIRQYIVENCDEFSAIISNKAFKSTFGGLSSECKILKRPPRGFSADSPHVDLLKHSAFYVLKRLERDDFLTQSNFSLEVCELFKISSPLHQFLNRSIQE